MSAGRVVAAVRQAGAKVLQAAEPPSRDRALAAADGRRAAWSPASHRARPPRGGGRGTAADGRASGRARSAARVRAGGRVLAGRWPGTARDRARARAPGRGARRDRGADARPRARARLRAGGVEAARRARGGRASRDARGDGERRDLRGLATFTIDPASARDFDDAISAEAARAPDGACACGCTSPMSPRTCRRARSSTARRAGAARACMCPARSSRCCPHALSSDACSLVPGAERAAVTVELELHGREVERAAFYRSLIRSDARLDYERVDRIFAGASARPSRGRAAAGGRARVRRGAGQRARERAGALVSTPQEPEFCFDEHGNVSEHRARAQTESHRLIEHLMIAANEAVAGCCPARRCRACIACTSGPSPRASSGWSTSSPRWRCRRRRVPERMSPAQAAELIGEAISAGRAARAAAARGRAGVAAQRGRWVGRGGRIALTSLVLRSLKQAYYSPKNLGHAGLHSAATATSPRRSAATPTSSAIARCCRRSAAGSRAAGGELVELGEWTSEREREAMKIERDADDVARVLRARARAVRGRLGAGVRGRGHGPDLGGRVRRVRRLGRGRGTDGGGRAGGSRATAV